MKLLIVIFSIIGYATVSFMFLLIYMVNHADKIKRKCSYNKYLILKHWMPRMIALFLIVPGVIWFILWVLYCVIMAISRYSVVVKKDYAKLQKEARKKQAKQIKQAGSLSLMDDETGRLSL